MTNAQPPEDIAEIQRLLALSDRGMRALHALLTVLREHDREMAALAERVRDLELLAWTDRLTGLLSRRGLEEELGREEARVRRYQTPATVALLEVADLAATQEHHGHAAADALLRVVAAAVRDAARGSDIVARWSADTFAALLPGAGIDGARVFLDRVRTAAQFARLPDGAIVPIRLITGLAARDENGSLQAALARADERLRLGRQQASDR